MGNTQVTKSHLLKSLFGHSPIRPLQLHMAKVHVCAQELSAFFQSILADNWLLAKELQQKIVHFEREADQMKKDLRLHMPKSLFMPVPRSDILAILTNQDKIANRVKDIAGLVIGRQMFFPDALKQPYLHLLERCLDAVAQAHQAIDELDALLETGFSGNEIRIIEQMISQLDTIESETDNIQSEVRQTLYLLEKNLSPVDVVFMYKLIEWTGDIADYALAVGGQIYLLLAK